ncbi:MAG: hypothetical protein PHF57_12600 [Methanoregula sp.]|jgi:hypothetical protein|nr:hypothetical protein [Methanoregula sp.]
MTDDPFWKPSQGTSIFKGSLLSRNSCRLHKYGDQWDAYTYGWKWAINVLLKEAKTGFHPTDVHYYPIFYVFRHYLEIKFKELIKDLNQYVNQKEKIVQGHNIESLWIECKGLLIEFLRVDESEQDDPDIKDENEDDFILIEGFIKELHFIDPYSQSFRYPTDKTGKLCINGDELGPVDMDHFADIAMWVTDYLEGVSVGIYEIYQQRCENMAEQRQYELENSDFDPGDCYP